MRVDLETERAFNHALARRLGARQVSGSERVLLALDRGGAPVSLLRERLALDAGYLGRLLRSLERDGLVRSGARGSADAHRRRITLTRKGAQQVSRLKASERVWVRALFALLSSCESRELLGAMRRIAHLASGSLVVIGPEDPAGAAARRCFANYFDELDARFPGGFDRRAGGGTQRTELLPPRGRLLIARLGAVPVGCGAIRQLAPGILEIKRMWVAPSVRGLGIGRDLLEALERIARRRRAQVIRLDTHATLSEALRLYRRAGYRRIARYNDNPYAERWFEKQLGSGEARSGARGGAGDRAIHSRREQMKQKKCRP